MLRNDFSITSGNFINISSKGKKLRQFSSSGHFPPFTFNVGFFQESMRVNDANGKHSVAPGAVCNPEICL